MMQWRFAVFTPMALLSACGEGVDPQETVAVIRQTEQTQLEAIGSGDLRGIERLYAPDAKLVKPDGTVLDGREAIMAEYERLLVDPNFAIETTPEEGWAAASDDLAVVDSKVNFVTSDPETGAATRLPMESTATWSRASGATWQIVSAYNVGIAQDLQPVRGDSAPD